MKKHDSLLLKLFERDGSCCARCGKPLSGDNSTIDHIFPRSLGGRETFDNLQVLCMECNSERTNRFVKERELLLYLKHMLESDGQLHNVTSDVKWKSSDGANQIFDLTFTKEVDSKEQFFIVEVKMITAATKEKVEDAIQQMRYYQGIVPEAKLVLAIPILLAEEYREIVTKEGFLLWDRETLYSGIPFTVAPRNSARDQYDELLERLQQCKTGFDDWRIYQQLVGEIAEALFCPPLNQPVEQNADGNYANRRDFILPNYAETGYWRYLRERYGAEFILVDAKNSGNPIEKDDILQISHYLKKKGLGMFGLIFSRFGINSTGSVHLQDIWLNEDKMLIVFDDSDVKQMILSKQSKNDPCIVLLEKIQEFRQKI